MGPRTYIYTEGSDIHHGWLSSTPSKQPGGDHLSVSMVVLAMGFIGKPSLHGGLYRLSEEPQTFRDRTGEVA